MIASFPSVAEDYNGPFDSDSVQKGAGTSINPVKKQCWKQYSLNQTQVQNQRLQSYRLQSQNFLQSCFPYCHSREFSDVNLTNSTLLCRQYASRTACLAKRICRILCMSLSMDNIPELSFQICEELRAAGSILRVQHVSTVNSLNYFNKIFKECNSQKFRLFKILPCIGSY